MLQSTCAVVSVYEQIGAALVYMACWGLVMCTRSQGLVDCPYLIGIWGYIMWSHHVTVLSSKGAASMHASVIRTRYSCKAGTMQASGPVP